MQYDYPLLNKVLDYYKTDADLSDVVLFACQHLLEPQLEMFKCFIDFGMQPQNIFVLGKAYSTNHEIADELRNLGVQVATPAFEGTSFDSEHSVNCHSFLAHLIEGKRNIILDDGASLLEAAIKENKNVLFGVEQTSSGFRKLQKLDLPFPVLNVARSETKLNQESPFIAQLSWLRVREYLIKADLSSPKVLVVGLGPIGKALISQTALESTEGFDVSLGHLGLIEKIKSFQPDVIIGATGSCILEEAELEELISDHKYHLISVSSSDREFPVSKHRTGLEVHKDVQYKNFVFVNNGFPITFKGNRNECSPEEMEKTIALLEGSILHGIIKGAGAKGLTPVPEELEKIINS